MFKIAHYVIICPNLPTKSTYVQISFFKHSKKMVADIIDHHKKLTPFYFAKGPTALCVLGNARDCPAKVIQTINNAHTNAPTIMRLVFTLKCVERILLIPNMGINE